MPKRIDLLRTTFTTTPLYKKIKSPHPARPEPVEGFERFNPSTSSG
jgi:hypothetical protein